MPASPYPPSCSARGREDACRFRPIPRFEHDALDFGVDGIQEGQAAHVALARANLVVDLVVSALPQARAIECRRYSHWVLQQHIAKVGAHEMNDLLLILICDDVLGDEDLKKSTSLPSESTSSTCSRTCEHMRKNCPVLAKSIIEGGNRHDDAGRGEYRIDGHEA